MQRSVASVIIVVAESCEIWLRTEMFCQETIFYFNIQILTNHCLSFAWSADENYGRAVLNQYKSQDSLHRYSRESAHFSNDIVKENWASFYYILFIARTCFVQF